MTPEELASLEQAYATATQGTDEPQYMLAPEGAFFRNEDGSVTVFAFDAEGNHYALPVEEQERRKERLRKRLGI